MDTQDLSSFPQELSWTVSVEITCDPVGRTQFLRNKACKVSLRGLCRGAILEIKSYRQVAYLLVLVLTGILWPWQKVSYYMYIDNLLYWVAFDSMVTNFSRPPFTYACLVLLAKPLQCTVIPLLATETLQ